MYDINLRRHLEALRNGSQSVDGVMRAIRDLPYQDLGFAKVDHHRPLRTGFPEVVLGLGKTKEEVAQIVASMTGRGHPVLVTKASLEAYREVCRNTPEAEFNPLARTIIVPAPQPEALRQGVLVLTAGTVDLGVAEEAAVTANLMGSEVVRVNDVGVAGLHRLLDSISIVREARVIVVVAGMDAAVTGVVAGLVSAPVIAVPTSAGYGASFEGLAALLSMLNSCAPGVAVMNIDNGFGAGYMAAQINRMDRGGSD